MFALKCPSCGQQRATTTAVVVVSPPPPPPVRPSHINELSRAEYSVLAISHALADSKDEVAECRREHDSFRSKERALSLELKESSDTVAALMGHIAELTSYAKETPDVVVALERMGNELDAVLMCRTSDAAAMASLKEEKNALAREFARMTEARALDTERLERLTREHAELLAMRAFDTETIKQMRREIREETSVRKERDDLLALSESLMEERDAATSALSRMGCDFDAVLATTSVERNEIEVAKAAHQYLAKEHVKLLAAKAEFESAANNVHTKDATTQVGAMQVSLQEALAASEQKYRELVAAKAADDAMTSELQASYNRIGKERDSLLASKNVIGSASTEIKSTLERLTKERDDLMAANAWSVAWSVKAMEELRRGHAAALAAAQATPKAASGFAETKVALERLTQEHAKLLGLVDHPHRVSPERAPLAAAKSFTDQTALLAALTRERDGLLRDKATAHTHIQNLQGENDTKLAELQAALRAAAKELDDAKCELRNVSAVIGTYGTAHAETRVLLGKATAVCATLAAEKAAEVAAHAETKSSLERLRKDHEALAISKATFYAANIEVKTALDRLTREHAELLAMKITYQEAVFAADRVALQNLTILAAEKVASDESRARRELASSPSSTIVMTS